MPEKQSQLSEDIDMKKTILVASLAILLTAGLAMAQMMGGGSSMMGTGQGAGTGQQMMEQNQAQKAASGAGGQYYNQRMNPGMMGGYGYGMGPGMMGGYGMGPGMMGGYGMGPGMMGPGMMHGYGMGPGMMGGYGGYGMGSGMMGGYGHSMHHNMMGGGCYGMGPGMMGGYGHGMGPGMMGYHSPEQYEKQFRENQEFLNDTKTLRKKLHDLKFDYGEAWRDPETKPEDLEKINAEMKKTRKQIYEKKLPASK
jgi:hypothetical protein